MGFVLSWRWLCLMAPFVLSLLTCGESAMMSSDSSKGFDENYVVTWGGYHVVNLNGGSEVKLSMDQSSGAGFSSRYSYDSGFFHMKIKLPNKNSAGIVTAYYLSSTGNNHDEVDFEFLGNKEGKPITLQTNIYMNGQGGREQRLDLWFDPTADFHDYKFLWNPYHLVFWVDETPIRVLKNLTRQGAEFPSQPMKIVASLWNGDSWATDGGLTKTDWSQAPFTAQFQGFDVAGCVASAGNSCASPSHWWNGAQYQALKPNQSTGYENVKKNYITYDYCADRARYPTQPPECVLGE
ncbi:Xyloglucan endotransglucosylase/hydrolase [Rhynchospora pubera]|uniref:Xyloglucan endotransglucosylase/hydrolase n=1 Tax=Rhynchospora pubera TaxID=906938 RepID=A0AAV8ETT4_9POAL|nr:Xyloglucan endotransglucosylase/hydrolase [Rhynchospora pubera]